MKLSTQDLQALAQIYGATITQLQAPPSSADLVAKLDRAQTIIEKLDPDALEQWLAVGDTLAKAKR